MNRSLDQSIVGANRIIHREQMDRFGGELSWLSNPGEVDVNALGKYQDGSLQEQCFAVATWTLLDIQDWATRTQSKLNWAEIFEKYPVPNADRVQLRDRVRLQPMLAYAPGVLAMSEMVAVAPYIAARDGESKSQWEEIAAQSRKFGAKISRSGTDLQLIIREHLHSEERSEAIPGLKFLDPAKLKLDTETGITTVTPIDEMVTKTLSQLTKRTPEEAEDLPGVCIALQAKAPAGCEHATTMFDAVWMAYSSITARLVYPNFEIAPDEVPAQEEPNANFEAVANAGIDHINAEYLDSET